MTTKQKIDHTARLNDQIAEKLQTIVDALDNGASASDFEMPFKSVGCRPYNPATGHAATGTNALICMMMGATFYSTYDGWQKLGYQVTEKAQMYLARPKKFKIGALLLCADLGISASMRADHVQYIASWLQALNDDRKYIFSAGALSQKAVNYLHGLQPENQTQAA